MWADTFIFLLDFQDGSGNRDVSDLVMRKTCQRSRRIWNKLSPTVNTLTFSIRFSSTIHNLLMTTDKDILITVTKNSTAWFTGIVRPNFDIIELSRIDTTRIECVDRGFLLQRKIMTSINWTNYDVCKPSGTGTSIVHQLLVAAGLTAGDADAAIPAVAKLIPNYIVIKGDTTYWDALSKITFEYGYAFYFTDAGKLQLYNFAPASVSAGANVLNAGAGGNMLGSFRISRAQREYDGVRVKWWEQDTFGSVVVASDTTGGTATLKCNIPLAAGAYYPVDSDTKDIYIDYEYNNYEIVGVNGCVLDIIAESGIIVDTFTDELKRAKLKIHNEDSAQHYITKLDVIGNAICKTVLNWTETPNPLISDKILDIETDWIYAQADAEKLSSATTRYYKYVAFIYYAKSKTAFNPGDIVAVQETSWLSINNTCVVTEAVDNLFTEEISYQLEGITAYTALSTSTSGTAPLGFTEIIDITLDGGAADTATWDFVYDGGTASSW